MLHCKAVAFFTSTAPDDIKSIDLGQCQSRRKRVLISHCFLRVNDRTQEHYFFLALHFHNMQRKSRHYYIFFDRKNSTWQQCYICNTQESCLNEMLRHLLTTIFWHVHSFCLGSCVITLPVIQYWGIFSVIDRFLVKCLL